MTLYSKLHLNSRLATFSPAVAKNMKLLASYTLLSLETKELGFTPPQVISPLDTEISKHLSYLNP